MKNNSDKKLKKLKILQDYFQSDLNIIANDNKIKIIKIIKTWYHLNWNRGFVWSLRGDSRSSGIRRAQLPKINKANSSQMKIILWLLEFFSSTRRYGESNGEERFLSTFKNKEVFPVSQQPKINISRAFLLFVICNVPVAKNLIIKETSF